MKDISRDELAAGEVGRSLTATPVEAGWDLSWRRRRTTPAAASSRSSCRTI
ncbi:hypothetical protein ABZ345_34875 [Lentzea sp. NPDC005914]|uniref:hypothetical protein n=1 Tax=Lentzea sp. NPDC005914 TaxID=3154572 RepID=UPI0033F6B5D5